MISLLGCAGCGDFGDTEPAVLRAAPSASAATSAPTIEIPPAPTGVPVVPPAPTTPPAPAVEQVPPLFADPVARAERAVPISGGTLLVTADGTTAVAADPDRAAVFLVDLATRAVRSVATLPGDEPGRVVEGAPGGVYVVLRGAGAVLAVDLATGSAGARIPVCGSPRGIAYDAASQRVHVACRSGRLVSIDAASASVLETRELEADLRDVFVRDDKLVVTRYRSAETLTVNAAGEIEARALPPPNASFASRVVHRAVERPDGALVLAHQLESQGTIGTGLGAYYGGGCFGGGVVQQALTTLPALGSGRSAVTRTLPGLTGPLDMAIARDGSRIAVVATGNSWPVKQEQPTLFVDAFDAATNEPAATLSTSPCTGEATQARYLAGEPVAVAFDANGRYLVQSREPALLELEGDIFISLSSESRFDTGLATFYLNTGGNISCASCHPEGGDDGHTWTFANFGYRRSQSLRGGVSASAPFHWSGDLPSFDALFTEVMLGRMALPVVPSAEHVAALAGWLDTLPAETPEGGLDAAAVERGRSLFNDAKVACATCHSGPNHADGRLYDVGTGGVFVTPSLLGVALRTPLMHDGCAKTLRARFGPCGGENHGDLSGLGEAEIDDLVTYLRSL